MKKIVLLMTFLLATALNIFSQVQEITERDYWEQYHAAVEMPFDISRRVTTKEEYFGNIPYIKETTDEFLNPDKRRYVEIYKSDKSAYKDELIQIGKVYYCRTNGDKWKKSEQWCAKQTIKSLGAATTLKFTVEETKLNNQSVKLYQQHRTNKKTSSQDKGKEETFYFDDKFWVDNNGFILRREMEYGRLEPKRIGERTVVVYEYNPKILKIKAPIK